MIKPTGMKRITPTPNLGPTKRTIPTSSQAQNTSANYGPMQVSRNDVVYCGSVVLRVADQVLSLPINAVTRQVRNLASDIKMKGVTTTMTPFITKLFSLLQAGVLRFENGQPFELNSEDLQCLRATLWYEDQLARQGGVDGVEFLKESIIYSAPANGVS